MKYSLFFAGWALLAFLQIACNQSGSHTATTAAVEKIRISNDGVNIDYADSGQGDTSLLFVHGWCINKNYWENQSAFFSPHYRVVAIDLPGYGNSGKNRKNWTVEAYGKDLSAVISQLDLQHVVLIGHSMAGQIIVEAARQNKDRVIGLVGVDNFKYAGPATSPSDTTGDAFYNAAKQDYKAAVLPSASAELFLPSTDSLIKKRVLDDILSAGPEIAIESLKHCDRYPGNTNLAALKKKIYLINSDATPTDTAGLKKRGVLFTVLPIHASGHYPMIEKPAEFNAQLAQALELIKKGN
jgi:pimeloyl-ACP methyl ester carboxylesterase